MIKKKWWIAGLLGLLVLGGAGVAWVEQNSLLAWYYVFQLERADEADRPAWVERTVSLDLTALPRLLDGLRKPDARACANAQAALLRFVQQWEAKSPYRPALASQLASAFPQLSPCGQCSALELTTTLVSSSQGNAPPAGVRSSAAHLLDAAVRVRERDVRVRALALTAALLEVPNPTAESLEAGRSMVRACLQDDDTNNRLQAINLVRTWSKVKLLELEQVAPLLNDPSPDVRRAALGAVGLVREAVRDDELLRSLHDPDPDVRRLCEAALRSRGLQEEHIRRGRLLTDPRAAVRLQVLDGLCQASDLEPGVWLRHLSHDPEPAVRAAAVRMAGEQTLVDLSDRLQQMATDDPSDTVRQLARHYLSCRKSNPAAFSRP
jgi:hypothetical protein